MKNKIIAACFNECNNMVFHDLSRNYEAASVYKTTSLLGLGPKCCPKNDIITFNNPEDITKRLRRDASMRWFVFKNSYFDAADEAPRLCTNNTTWEPKK